MKNANSNKIVIIIIGILVLGLGGYFVYDNVIKGNSQKNDNVENENSKDDNENSTNDGINSKEEDDTAKMDVTMKDNIVYVNGNKVDMYTLFNKRNSYRINYNNETEFYAHRDGGTDATLEYEIIDEYKDKYPIIVLCNYMKVSKSGYYKWKYRQKHPSQKELARQRDIELIKEIHEKHPSHGYRWINAFIRNKYGIIMSDNHVHLCCKYEGIRSKGKHYQWKKPGEQQYKFNNLIWNGWKYLSKPFEVIVSDMTAFWVKGTYYELTLYFDAWNKEIVGYGLSSRKGSIHSYYDGLNQVLERIKKEQTDQLIILHTDQGSVYSSESYNKLLDNYNIERSMSRAGTPTDNPVNESLNGWIKEELIIDFDLKHCSAVPKLIEEYIYYYNNERPSYALKYKTPIQYKIESGF